MSSLTKSWTKKYPAMKITSEGDYFVFWGEKCFRHSSYSSAEAIWRTLCSMCAGVTPVHYSSNFFMRGSKLLIILSIIDQGRDTSLNQVRESFSKVCPPRSSDCSWYLTNYSKYFDVKKSSSNLNLYNLNDSGRDKIKCLMQKEKSKIKQIKSFYNVIYS